MAGSGYTRCKVPVGHPNGDVINTAGMGVWGMMSLF